MDEKNKDIVILVISFVLAILFGYIIMYIKSPNKIDINTIGVYNASKTDINFTNYLYDLDGDNDSSTSVKILNDKSLYIVINGKEFSYKDFSDPISVRVCHSTKNGGYNIIYVLNEDKVYFVKDIEFEERVNTSVKKTKNKKGKTVVTKNPVFDEVPLDNIKAISVISDFDKDSGNKHPTIYLKNKDDVIYVSKMGSGFTKLEKE